MDLSSGWIGSWAELAATLERRGCDRDETGRYCVGGRPGTIVSFMGAGDEFVVSAGAVYYAKGEARDLRAALEASGAGLTVTVV